MGGSLADGQAAEVQRDGARLLAVFLIAWIAMAVGVDGLLTRGERSLPWTVGLRGLGVVVLVAARVAIVRAEPRAVLAIEAIAGAVTSGLSALGAAHIGFEAAYVMTPVLWCLALIGTTSPRRQVAIAMGACWIASFTVVAALGGDVGWRHLVTSTLVAAGVLGLAAHISQRLWELRHKLYESRRLAHYRMLSPIAHGGMNDVWLAWDESRRRECALKLLHTPGTAELTRRQFAREAELVRLVRSPHTVRIHDYGASDDGFAYIALEYLRGMDLDALVHTFGPLEPRRAVRLMRDACSGLGAAHVAGVIHRDIKPANLHCSDAKGSEDFVRILDFGVARTIDDVAVPGDGTVAGTPAYMSPEAFRGEDRSPASDVYSLGATFYFALTGVPPIDADSPSAFRQAHERAPIVPPSLRVGVEISRAIEKIVLRCLAKQASDRYPDATAVGAALDAAVDRAEAWTQEDATRWWHRARVGQVPTPISGAEHTTDVEVPRLRDTSGQAPAASEPQATSRARR
jgi:hypothetical protein